MKEQLTAVFGKRQITQFIEDHKIKSKQSCCDFAGQSNHFLLLKLICQIHQVIKLALPAIPYGLGRYSYG